MPSKVTVQKGFHTASRKISAASSTPAVVTSREAEFKKGVGVVVRAPSSIPRTILATTNPKMKRFGAVTT